MPKSASSTIIGFGLLIVWTGCLQIILDKGQEDDWFGAIWLALGAFFLVLALLLVHAFTRWRKKDLWSTYTSSKTATSPLAAS